MKSIAIAVIVLIILGGGYYLYMQQDASPAEEMNNDAVGIQQTSDETGAPLQEEDAAGNPTGGTNTGSGAGTGTSVDVGVGAGSTGGGTSGSAGATGSVTTGAVRSFTVDGANFTFAPASMQVKKGDTVRITFKNTSGTHDLVIDEFNARTKILNGGAQETIEFVANKAGSFEYYCSVGQHRALGMKGTLVVTE